MSPGSSARDLPRSEHPQLPPDLTFHIILEELFRPKFKDVIQLLLGHGARLRAKPRTDNQVGEHHLPFGHLGDPLLHGGSRHEAVDHHLLVLPDAVSSAERLQAENKAAEQLVRSQPEQ